MNVCVYLSIHRIKRASMNGRETKICVCKYLHIYICVHGLKGELVKVLKKDRKIPLSSVTYQAETYTFTFIKIYQSNRINLAKNLSEYIYSLLKRAEITIYVPI